MYECHILPLSRKDNIDITYFTYLNRVLDNINQVFFRMGGGNIWNEKGCHFYK